MIVKTFPDTCQREGVREERTSSPPALACRCISKFAANPASRPALPERVSAGPEVRQDGVGRKNSSRDPTKNTWGAHLPPLNLAACIALACSCSSARRRCHSPHHHQSPCRRGRDLRLQGSSPCMCGSSSAAFAQRAGLRDHQTIRQKNAYSTRLPCSDSGQTPLAEMR